MSAYADITAGGGTHVPMGEKSFKKLETITAGNARRRLIHRNLMVTPVILFRKMICATMPKYR